MQHQLKSKRVLITGGGTGIGRACALLFAREGADISICGLQQEPLETTAQEIREFGVRAHWSVGDIGSEADVQRIFEEAVDALGGLDGLINNAAVVGQVAPVQRLDLDAWNEVLRVNLTGAMLCCRAAVPHLSARSGGTIVNVSSNVGRRGFPNRAPYVCSKWALHGLTQTLALEVADSGIRVNAICPGPVETERLRGAMLSMAKERGVSLEVIREQWVAESPMGRFATEEECAQVALFLSSDASSSMTGQALNVTAGALMT